MARSRILSQMFDVRPVDETGDLDWEKIEKIEKTLYLQIDQLRKVTVREDIEKKQEEKIIKKGREPVIEAGYETKIKRSLLDEEPAKEKEKIIKEPRISQLNKSFKADDVPVFQEVSPDLIDQITPAKPVFTPDNYDKGQRPVDAMAATDTKRIVENYFDREKYLPESEIKAREHKSKIEKYFEDEEETEDFGKKFSFSDLFLPSRYALSFNFNKIKKSGLSFAGAALAILIIVLAVPLWQKGIFLKDRVLGVSTEGLNNLESAVENVKNQNLDESSMDFREAYLNFSQASDEINDMGGFIIDLTQHIPFASKLSSGKNLVEAGKHISLAGGSINEVMKIFSEFQNPISNQSSSSSVSLLDIFKSAEEHLGVVKKELEAAQNNIEKVSVNDLPEEKRNDFVSMKSKLPAAIEFTNGFLANSDILVDILGGNGPRKYLFLFKNNHEMRATGGFVGSYGLIDIWNGEVRKFFVDGIFNPDGQLKEKVVPPKPIQKISAAWSLHDSNWFPNFPTSAEKAILFYERTGGPTVDGVITLTPKVMEEFLKITGPIEMEEYDVTLDSDNFIEKTLHEVEVDYDKDENRPKKILADLAPIVLDKILNSKDLENISKTLTILSKGLSERHILLYSQNSQLQEMISERGWSGEILNTSKDYLSVVNTNINGYKTDGVIDETIDHKAEIQEDGSVIDTIVITRKHNGGNGDFEWWNKVNANYMRVYVPKGAKLLEVEGQTREFVEPPLDYDALGFIRDEDIEREENNMKIDQKTGTRIYEEEDKTVFANWTYVSPQETVMIKYKYLLPFKISLDRIGKAADSYSILFQKQSGSVGSKLNLTVKYPEYYDVAWSYPGEFSPVGNEVKLETDLAVDRFVGLVFKRESSVINNEN